MIADEERFLKVGEVALCFGLSAREIWRRVAAGRFPKPMKLGPKSTRWSGAELANHMQKFKDEREN